MSTERTTIAYGVEATFGTPPTGSGDFSYLKHTGEGLDPGIQTARAAGFYEDRLPGDTYLGGFLPAGPVNGTLGYGTHDDILPFAFGQSDWSTARTTTASLTVVASTRTITMTAAFANMVVGEWFEISGSSSNDGKYKIETRTSDDEVIVKNGFFTLSDEGPTASVEIAHDGRLVVGTTRTGITLEKNLFHQGASEVFAQFKGSVPGSTVLGVASGGEMTIVTNYLCKAVSESDATIANGTIAAASTNRAFRAAGDMKNVWVDGLDNPDGYSLIDWSATLDNAVRQDPMQSDDAANMVYDVAFGNVGNSSCQFQVYFDRDIYTKFLAFTSLGFAVEYDDGTNGAMIFDWHDLKATGGLPAAGAPDQPQVANLTCAPNQNSNGDFFSITRFAA